MDSILRPPSFTLLTCLTINTLGENPGLEPECIRNKNFSYKVVAGLEDILDKNTFNSIVYRIKFKVENLGHVFILKKYRDHDNDWFINAMNEIHVFISKYMYGYWIFSPLNCFLTNNIFWLLFIHYIVSFTVFPLLSRLSLYFYTVSLYLFFLL